MLGSVAIHVKPAIERARVSMVTHDSWKAGIGRLNDAVALDDRKFVVALAWV
jgi:hypothetical protein